MIEFQKAYRLDYSKKYIDDCLASGHLEGDGKYTNLCTSWLRDRLEVNEVFMTTSCTHALELALNSIDLSYDDEVIVPSFTYPSTANAVLMAGGKVVFSQVRQEDMTLDPKQIEEKITSKTRAIIPVHYGGNMADMDAIMKLASKHNLLVIEDAAQSFLSTYKGKLSGTIGDFGCYSFHGTKDLVAGEGGALVVNNSSYVDVVKVFRDKGTNREAFLAGDVAYYEWVAKGSSYGPSELLMALLYGQLELSDAIIERCKAIYESYYKHFEEAKYDGLTSYGQQASGVRNNGHIYYIVFNEIDGAKSFIHKMKDKGVQAYTHFVPLHSSRFGSSFTPDTLGFDVEEGIGQRLVRLPIYPDLTEEQVKMILSKVDESLRG